VEDKGLGHRPVDNQQSTNGRRLTTVSRCIWGQV
jgi:hypothetical protein